MFDLTRLKKVLLNSSRPKPDADLNWGHLWSIRLGFVHIPKSAGQSIGLAVSEAWGLHYRTLGGGGQSFQPEHPFLRNPFHISARRALESDSFGLSEKWSRANHEKTFTVAANQELRDISFLTGHVSLSQMRLLGRSSLFTVIRNPYERALSHYSFRGRLEPTGIPNSRPRLEDFLRDEGNYMTKWLFAGSGKLYLSEAMWDELWTSPIEESRSLSSQGEWRKVIRERLREFDLVFIGLNPQRVLDSLFEKGYLPRKWKAKTINASIRDYREGLLSFRDKQQLEGWLHSGYSLDRMLYEEAALLFPDQVAEEQEPDAGQTAHRADRWLAGL